MRRIAFISTSRADHSGYLPIVTEMTQRDVEVTLLLSGAKTDEVAERERAWLDLGVRTAETIVLESDDTAVGASRAMGAATSAWANTLAVCSPDILVVLGDRYEMHAAATAALPQLIPVAHIHGGELTFGAFDDSLRHSMTKLSHLHFVATETYARRVLQLGEEPWRVITSGAPALDNLRMMRLMSLDELSAALHVSLESPPIVVTFHPTTLEPRETEQHTQALLQALETRRDPIVITSPNADPQGSEMRRQFQAFSQDRKKTHYFDDLGTLRYFSLMASSKMLVGNSSSGIIEAASFALPVVNIGTRQEGRVRGLNVIDVGYESEEVVAGIERAESSQFSDTLHALENPYGNGWAAPVIADRLISIPLDEILLRKRFLDQSTGR